MEHEACKAFLGRDGIRWQGVAKQIAPGGRVIAHLRDPLGGDQVAISDLAREIALIEAPRKTPPLFISYYTTDTPYEALADQLRRSLDRFGLPHRIEPIESRGSWVANTGLKSRFISEVWHSHDGPVCWIDADAEILRPPGIVFGNPFDFAVVRRHGWYDLAGFVYLGKTEAAGALVRDWAALCAQNPHVWDQVLLTLAWYRMAGKMAMSSLWLNDGIFRFPRPWIRDLRDRLFYYPRGKKIRPLIDQKQASRQLKSFVDASKRNENERGSDDISQAFRDALQRYRFGLDLSVDALFE